MYYIAVHTGPQIHLLWPYKFSRLMVESVASPPAADGGRVASRYIYLRHHGMPRVKQPGAGRLARLAAHMNTTSAAGGAKVEAPTPWMEQLLANIDAAGPLARGRRFDTNGGPGHKLPEPDEVVPLAVDADFRALPSELRRVRAALQQAADEVRGGAAARPDPAARGRAHC
jgi:hypothetical protein